MADKEQDDDRPVGGENNWVNKWLRPVVIGASSGLVVVLATQFFFHKNKATEEKTALKREVVKAQFLYLKKMKRVADIGSRVSVNIYTTVYIDPNTKQKFGEDKVGIQFNLPSLASNMELRGEWQSLVDEIVAAKDAIDPEVYAPFKEVVEFARKNPWPLDAKNMAYVENSPWSTQDVLGRWMALNGFLNLRIEKYLALEE